MTACDIFKLLHLKRQNSSERVILLVQFTMLFND